MSAVSAAQLHSTPGREGSTAVSVSGLVKTFGPTRALDGLDLTVATGEVHGFLGPNGAGKTTTIRILLGLLRTDAGEVRLLGGDPWREAVRLHRRLAYVPGDVSLWPKLTGGEIINVSGGCAAISVPLGGTRSWSGSSWIRRRRRAPTPRAAGRRWGWWPRWRPAPSCCSWTSRPRASTR